MDRFPDAWIGAAAADVSAHGGVDQLVVRIRVRFEERRGGHDLAGLAETALRHAELDPGLLAGVIPAETLDGCDLGEVGHTDVDRAGAHGPAVEVDGAGAALRDAASELGSLQPQLVAEEPEKGMSGSTSTIRSLPFTVT